MKIRHLFLAMMASAAALVSCDKEQEQPSGLPKITPSETAVAFDQNAGEKTITLVANRDWKVEKDAEWLEVTPAEGKASDGEVTVTFKVTANEGTNRSAVVKFNANTVSAEVKVTQEGPVAETFATLAEVRAMATPGSTAKIADGTVVKTVVVSSAALSNMTSLKNIFMQDETAGIGVRFDNNHKFAQGDELKIDLSGQELSFYNGGLQINNLPLEKVEVLSSGKELVAKDVTFADFIDNKYEGQYVAVPEVQVIEADINRKFVEGDSHTSITLQNKEGRTFEIFSAKYSDELKNKDVPDGSGTLKGIASYNNGKISVVLAFADDADGLTGERFQVETPEPGEIKDVTIEQFLAEPVSDVNLYRLTGQITNIENTEFGNLWIQDEGGNKLYVYGMKASADADNKSFASIGLKEGYFVTFVGKRAEYNGNAQAKDTYHESHEEGTLPEDPEAKAPMTSSLAYTGGENAYTEEKATINENADIPVVKIGTSKKKNGNFTVTVPGGSGKIGFYAVSWKGEAASVTFEGATSAKPVNPESNAGATGLNPYTLTVTGGDYYVLDVTAETVTFNIDKGRAIFWGFNPVTE